MRRDSGGGDAVGFLPPLSDFSLHNPSRKHTKRKTHKLSGLVEKDLKWVAAIAGKLGGGACPALDATKKKNNA